MILSEVLIKLIHKASEVLILIDFAGYNRVHCRTG